MISSLGLFGCGKMGAALLGGLIRSGAVRPEHVRCTDINPEAANQLAATYGVSAVTGVEEAARSEALLICVKPPDVEPLLREISEFTDGLVISIAAGVKLGALETAAGSGARVARVMPNTPALIGKGMSGYCLGAWATEADAALVEAIFSSVGEVVRVKEPLMDAVTGLSGSGPAYVFTIIEALADGGCLKGLPKAQAIRMAAQTVAGAAELVLSSGEHPAVLRDQVTSPGGTTIAGLAAMEKAGVRSGLIEAVKAATQRSVELG